MRNPATDLRRAVRRGIVAAAATLAYSAPLPAQAPTEQPVGRITGRVIDASTGQGITAAAVQLVGTTNGTQTGIDGRFTIVRVPAGTATIQVRRIGYGPKTVTGIIVPADGGVEVNVSLATADVQLAAVSVTASAERGTVNEALDKQRSATGIVNSVTAEQISRSPDSDAAQAIQRVSGVTVQDGRSVFVRGLGERYTVTNLNGARLPSPEPEKRFVPLDIFPSALLQSINTTKTFTPELSGDFSGASVDIETREFPVKRTYVYSTSVGINDAATGRRLPTAPTVGSEWLGLGGSARQIPSQLATASAVGGLTTRPLMNEAVNSLRNAWTPVERAGLPNGSVGVSVGGQDPIFGVRVGYLASFTYSTTQEVRADDYQANPIQRDGRPQVLESWSGQAGRRGVLWGGMLNGSAMLGSNTRIAFNNTYTRTADNEARLNEGPSFFFSGINIQRNTLRFVERAIRSSQLKGEHALGARQALDWSVSSSGVLRKEPDRSDLVYAQFEPGGAFAWSDGNPDVARRTFGNLAENNLVGGVNYRLAFSASPDAWVLKTGATVRATNRDAVNRQFSIVSNAIPVADRARRAEELFDGRFTQGDADQFNVINVAEDGVYDASERLAAGYAMLEVPLSSRFRLIAGARVEDATITVNTSLSNNQRFRSQLANVDVLPAAVLNVKLGERSQLRASASQTLARPEYRELSPVQYLEVIGGQITRGNSDLVRTLIQNYDIKYERFPNPGEVLSVGVFAKRFDRPIERIDIATGGAPIVSFFNAAGAENLGVELEARKGLGGLASALEAFSVFSNVTLMRSTIEIGTGASANTNANRAMMGQAPWVANVGGMWTSRSGRVSANLLYSAVGPRIYSAGSVPFPDVEEATRHLVDFSLRLPMTDAFQLKVDAKNLLDAPFRLTQGPVTREEYRLGRQLSIGAQWRR
jgi:hypothetical protein